MKIGRAMWKSQPVWVEIDSDNIYLLAGDRFAKPKRGDLIARKDQIKLLAPIEANNKVVGLFGNYAPRGNRKGPQIFIKPTTAVVGPDDAIVRHKVTPTINFEAELGVVISKTAKNVPITEAMNYVLGYTITNDVTSFPLFAEDVKLGVRFKMFDTFCPLGPWIATDVDGQNLRLTSRLNGEIRQDSSTSKMTFGVAETIAWISSVLTLRPGDVISMGTPPGNAEMKPGDIISCEAEGIGVLTNRVTD